MPFQDFWLLLANTLLSPIAGNPAFLLFFVMILVPVCLNTVQIKIMSSLFSLHDSEKKAAKQN